MKQILSLGAGVQSTALLLMSANGLLPKLDLAIFADTQWEPEEVYTHLDWLSLEAEKAGIRVVRVTAGNIREAALSIEGKKFASMPLYTIDENGKKNMVRRQCTREFKIAPIDKYLRTEVLGLAPGQHSPREAVLHMWLGISSNEMGRVKQSRDPWKVHRFPLLGDIVHDPMLPKPWKRRDCIEWMQKEYPLLKAPRSACIGCPYHSNHEWRRIKDDPKAWDDAVDFDRQIRAGTDMTGEAFLHRDCKPLDEVDLRTDIEKGQGVFSFDDECDGMCGV